MSMEPSTFPTNRGGKRERSREGGVLQETVPALECLQICVETRPLCCPPGAPGNPISLSPAVILATVCLNAMEVLDSLLI